MPPCEIKTPHISLYFDEEMKSADGNGWAVEFSDGESTYRFPLLRDAFQFIASYEHWFGEVK